MSLISSLDRALDILNIMYENGGKMSVSELSKIMGLHKSTVYRTLNTLYQKEFLYKDNRTSMYSLGPRVLTMGLVAATNMPLAKIAKPYLTYLSNKYEVKSSIFIIEGEGEEQEKKCVFCLEQYIDTVSTTLLSTQSQCEASSAYRPAIGMCLLAYNNDGPMTAENEYTIDSWRKLSKKIIKNNYTINTFVKDLEEIKKLGYAYENEDYIHGQIAIACPVFNAAGKAVATISIDGNKKNILSNFGIEEIINDLIKYASIINEEWEKYNCNHFISDF